MAAGHAQTRPQGLNRLARITLALAFVALLAGGRDAASPTVAQAQVSCPAQPAGLAPSTPGSSRFTMLIRINQQENVNTYTNPNELTGGLGGRIYPQDIFVINTRFVKTPQPDFNAIATNLRTAFPCNRIIALNGLGFNFFEAGYAFSLIDHPAVFALMSDFEPMDWNGTAATAPGRPPWSSTYKTALARIKTWMGGLSGALASNAGGVSKRAGLVPIDYDAWNYGEIARAIDKKNTRLGGRHLGPLSVQTQDHCANGGASGFAARVKEIADSYKFRMVRKTVTKKGKKKKILVRRKIKKKAKPNRANLSTQISFSDTPNPSAGMALTKTSAFTAAACTVAGMQQGQGAFFYFASDDAMRLLFAQPAIAAMRPPPAVFSAKKN